MTDKEVQELRAERLAAKLRENLRRRKAQSRAMNVVPAQAGASGGEERTSEQDDRDPGLRRDDC